MTVSIILPTYNEKDNIVKLIPEIIKCIKRITLQYQILVIDDNSPDKTGKKCRQFFIKNKNVDVVVRKKERGFASAIKYGIEKATGEFIIVMDTDFSHDPRLIPLMLSKIKQYDIVIGSRYMKYGGGEDKIRYTLSKIYNIYLRFLLQIKITDFLFGYFCTRKDFLYKNNLLSKSIFTGFGDYFIRFVFYIHKAGGIFCEIPAYYKERPYGVSKSNLLKVFITYTITSLILFRSSSR